VIPLVAEGSMAHSKPFVASPAIQTNIGFPGELTDGWEQRAIGQDGRAAGQVPVLRVYMDACVHCGACSDKCHYFLGTGDPKNMPVARQDLMRAVYRRYFTFAGKHFPKLVGAVDMSKDVLDEWWSYYNQCSECRRCSVFCPYGIDTAEITMAAREIMDSVGLGQKYSNEIIGKVHKIGNNLGLPGPALEDTLLGLEEDVQGRHRRDVRYPLDVKGAEVLLVTPSRRLLRRAACRKPDRLRQGLPRRGHQLDAVVQGQRGRQLRHVHRQLRAAAQDRAAHPRGGAGAGRQAHRGGRMRARLARGLQLLEHAGGHRRRRQGPLRHRAAEAAGPRYKQPMHICELTWT
jgi:heterodisulfide reductase subunit C